MEWQPISTAPKDGRDVLIFSNGLVRVGFYSSRADKLWSVWPGRALVSPTHWMPLPEAPLGLRDGDGYGYCGYCGSGGSGGNSTGGGNGYGDGNGGTDGNS